MRSAHFRLPLACSLAFVACVATPPPDYTFGGSPNNANLSGDNGSTTPGGYTGLDGGYSDGGFADGGLPTTPCGSDSDGTAAGPPSDLVISELGIQSPSFIEVYNRNSNTVNLSSYTLQGSLTGQLSTGSLPTATHALVPATLPTTDGELAIFSDADGGMQMVFYVCWGPLGATTLQSQALTAQLWESTGQCVPVPPTGDSLHLTGTGTFPASWNSSTPTPLGCTE